MFFSHSFVYWLEDARFTGMRWCYEQRRAYRLQSSGVPPSISNGHCEETVGE